MGKGVYEIDFHKSVLRHAEKVTCDMDRIEVIVDKCGGGISLEGVPGTDKRYISGYITILEDHSLPLTVRFFVPRQTEERAYIRFVLLPGMRTRVCFDLTWLGMEKGGLHRTPGTLKQVIHGSRVGIQEVEKVELGVKEVFHDVHLCFEDFILTDEMPDEFPLPDEKTVDQFGQYTKKEWLGKIHNLEELKEAFYRNEGEAFYPFENRDKWGGDLGRRLKEGTGFFSTIKTEDGRWHLVDPDGHDYFSMGPCGTHLHCEGDITGVRKLLEWLPEENTEMQQLFYHRREHPWYPEMMESVNYLGANLYRVYGQQWEEKGKELAYRILMGNGINSQGNFPGLDVNNGKSRIPYVREIPGFPTTRTKIFRDFPDVLSTEYQHNSIMYASQLAGWKDDPWLIGYFLRNEPGFNFIPGIAVANEVLHNPEQTCCRAGLIQHLKEKYISIETLNEKWGSAFFGFEDLEAPFEDCMGQYPGSKQDLREYSVFLVREYCRIPSHACRSVDPNHLNLGLRWSKMNNPDMLAGWEFMDVFSFNCYSFDPMPDMEFVRNAGVDLPIMVGEFHCGALDRGLTSTGLKGVASQAQRGVMWREFVEKCAAHPYGVGAHWFQFTDEFCMGRFDGENYQIGLVDICMQPYKELMEAVRDTAQVLYMVKNGEKEAYDKMPEIIPMIG